MFYLLYSSLKEGRNEAEIQVQTANPIKMSFGKSDSPFRASHEYELQVGSLTTTKWTATGWCPKVVHCNMLGEQLHCSNW